MDCQNCLVKKLKFLNWYLYIYTCDFIYELEEFDKTGDWLQYALIFDELEIIGKSYLRHRMITKYDYKIILRKYGWLDD